MNTFFVVILQCLNASSILSSHGMSQEMGVTLSDFSYLCPALLNQIDGGACILHGDPSEHGKRGKNQPLVCFFIKMSVNMSIKQEHTPERRPDTSHGLWVNQLL